MKNFIKNLRTLLRNDKKLIYLFFINIGLIIFQVLYTNFRFLNINDLIPLWYTQEWGLNQLSEKNNIYIISIISSLLLFTGLVASYFAKKYYIRYGAEFLLSFVTVCVTLLTYSVIRIIAISSSDFAPILPESFLSLLYPFITAFVLMIVLAPVFIKIAFDQGIVTRPDTHFHPAMILSQPSARGGGFIYTVIFLAVSLFYVQPTKEIWGIILVMLILSILGLIDDYQNTNPTSRVRWFEHPFVRLGFLFSVVTLLVLFGVSISTISHPFGNGVLSFDAYNFTVAGISLNLLTSLVTVIWIVWILNLLSWSNGIDGQYGGIIGIVSLVLIVLALRYSPVTDLYKDVAVMSAVSAGTAFGLLRYTWHPSKIMWGFGAMAAGVGMSAFAILISAKISATILLILVPFFDATVTIIRRLLQKKNPLRGDRGHLHHLLLDRGWGHKEIAIFYWVVTGLCGLLAILVSDRLLVQTTLLLGGIVACGIILLNVLNFTKKKSPEKS